MIPLRLADGTRVGQIIGDAAIFPVSSRHYLGLARGFSLDASVLETVQTVGCSWIEFHHSKTKRVFRLSVEAFRANAKPYDFGQGLKWAAPETLYQNIRPLPPGQSNLYD